MGRALVARRACHAPAGLGHFPRRSGEPLPVEPGARLHFHVPVMLGEPASALLGVVREDGLEATERALPRQCHLEQLPEPPVLDATSEVAHLLPPEAGFQGPMRLNLSDPTSSSRGTGSRSSSASSGTGKTSPVLVSRYHSRPEWSSSAVTRSDRSMAAISWRGIH